ncbi:restriction endonuclease [Virgibacillus halodenitrificans]|uniref:Restriction endonuclease n=2 Tax=Virgibacillus halodenitrificans TaxID=1482 RepID=A0ABR7VV19_VIRHA|nr:restriction endonuclease [Virgibacillus halodenitrificans]
MPRIKLSESVGWPESTGRRWVKLFREYIPYVKKGNNDYYTNDSVRVLKVIKELAEKGYNHKEILQIFYENNGVPVNISEVSNLIENSSINKTKDIPVSKVMIIPFLNIIKDERSYSASYITEKITKYFELTDEQRRKSYENGKDSIFITRLRQTRYKLIKSGYVEEVSQSNYQITEKGLNLLNENTNEIKSEIEDLDSDIDPFEVIEENVKEIRDELALTVLQQIKKAHWSKLESIIVELLMSMGYGDGEITGKTNDGGIDGIIKEDKLGLENIYLQAKRYDKDNTIGSEQVRSFSGALDDMGATKGVFITTSDFTKGARDYTERLQSKKIVLINGEKLAKLMIDYNIGVVNKETFVVKKVDFSYFDEE